MHYYGYKLKEIRQLSYKQYIMLAEAMDRNIARDRLQDFEISIVPKMSDTDREKVRKRLYKQAYPENFKKQNVAKNLNSLVAKLRSGLSGK